MKMTSLGATRLELPLQLAEPLQTHTPALSSGFGIFSKRAARSALAAQRPPQLSGSLKAAAVEGWATPNPNIQGPSAQHSRGTGTTG